MMFDRAYLDGHRVPLGCGDCRGSGISEPITEANCLPYADSHDSQQMVGDVARQHCWARWRQFVQLIEVSHC